MIHEIVVTQDILPEGKYLYLVFVRGEKPKYVGKADNMQGVVEIIRIAVQDNDAMFLGEHIQYTDTGKIITYLVGKWECGGANMIPYIEKWKARPGYYHVPDTPRKPIVNLLQTM